MVRPGAGVLLGNERKAYQSLAWQCRYSGIEVPDHLWRHSSVGLGLPCADDQADDMVQEQKATVP